MREHVKGVNVTSPEWCDCHHCILRNTEQNERCRGAKTENCNHDTRFSAERIAREDEKYKKYSKSLVKNGVLDDGQYHTAYKKV